MGWQKGWVDDMPCGEGWDMPVEAEGWSDFHWWKIPSSRVLVMIMTSERPYWYSGHFVEGRMKPCQGDGCALCAKGVGAQARYLFSCVEPLTRKSGILEVSRSVALEFRDLAEARGQLRGLRFTIGKHTRHKQSRMEVLGEADDDRFNLEGFPPVDVLKALLLTWEKAKYDVPAAFRKKSLSSEVPSRPGGGGNGHKASGGQARPSGSPFRVTAEGVSRDSLTGVR